MADSGDEHYVTFGTPLDPLDEENLPRKKPVTLEDQYACDEQGRRRFHGAFTGGFSAGYFNSVGTRDGWRPQQFKSSRSSKAENKTQRPQDFMDDEDMGQFGIAPTAIQAHTNYTDHDKKGTKRERAKYSGDGPIPGTPVLRDLLKPVKDTVGVKLLKQMGWKPGQGVGPRLSKKEKSKIKQQNDKTKIYGCLLPQEQVETMIGDSAGSDDEDSSITFAPDDYEPFRCNPKDNFFGIGYSGLDKRPVLSQHVNLFDPAPFKLQEKNKKLSIRGQAFGVGAFEAEDEDIYSREDMSQYDFSLEPKTKQKSRWSKERPGTSQKECIEGFTAEKHTLETRKTFKPPELPKGYEPVHIVRRSRFEPKIDSTNLGDARRRGLAGHDLRAEDRARVINDPKPITLVLSDKISTQYTEASDHINVPKNSSDSYSFSCAIEGKSVAKISGTKNVSNDRQVPKKLSVVSNIITKTLNLHGREQAARNQEQSLNRLRGITRNDDVGGSSRLIKNNSWLEKLTIKNFVKGGTDNSSPNNDANTSPLQEVHVVKTTTAIAQSLLNFGDKITDDESKETCNNYDNEISYANQDGTFKPFVVNPEKQKRYDKFLAFSKSGEKSKLGSVQPLSMTEWERDRERVEFEQAARLYKPLTGSMGDRFVSGKHQDDLNPLNVVEKTEDADFQLREAATKKMFGKLTRRRIEWQPASILCKRFNIAEPRTGYLKQETEKKAKFSVFDYLEESVHNSSTFQNVTDVTGRIKSDNLNNLTSQSTGEGKLPDLHRYSGIRPPNNSAMLMCDNADKDRVSAKERNFEVQYERIFGKNVEILDNTVKDNAVSSDVQSSSRFTDFTTLGDKNLHEFQNSIASTSKLRPGGNSSELRDVVQATKSNEILREKSAEKKDLFKAIFLSSSEDSDSDGEEELDDEKLKSVLIGKNLGHLNVQRNTSPPRGIFANLDLDTLNSSRGKDSEINIIEVRNSTALNSNSDETLKASGSNHSSGNSSEDRFVRNRKDSIDLSAVKVGLDTEMLSDVYGPRLPVKPPNNLEHVSQNVNCQTQSQKQVIKSIVVPVKNAYTCAQGEWIEKKDKQVKKQKKKHKHKENKKHKHKKHKR